MNVKFAMKSSNYFDKSRFSKDFYQICYLPLIDSRQNLSSNRHSVIFIALFR